MRPLADPDNPLYATMQIVDLLALPGWDATKHRRIKEALVRAETFEQQQQLLAYTKKHVPSQDREPAV